LGINLKGLGVAVKSGDFVVAEKKKEVDSSNDSN